MPLEVLLLQNNRLSDIPSHFSRLGLLKTLNLSNNRLKSLPRAISLLPILDLDLSFNRISSISLGGSSLAGLQRFLVNGNGLQELSMSRAIDHLDVRHNQLASFDCARAKTVHAAHGTNALLSVNISSQNRVVDLSHNRLQLCRCNGTCSCSFRRDQSMNITSLDISHAMLSSLPPSLFNIQRLRILRLDHNSLLEFPSNRIKELGTSKSCHVPTTLSSHSQIYAHPTRNSGCSIFITIQLSNSRSISGISH
ncbi:hypothetical protein BD779DRAFT_510442 [Infundibulicybe gibba]|nr:hypothetical protein BD779DRAFT_510442 [Infundibulicybe gibba]